MSGHEHTNRCYWDYLEARWECRPAREELAAVTEFAAVVVRPEAPVDATAGQVS
ncbi:MAG: hypothetical protein QOJ34_863 [Pseudonocardiales bacterium]|nr:hypothetical protein [Pseudonocardiales bacterium]